MVVFSRDGQFPSDHQPILARLRLKEKRWREHEMLGSA